MKKLLFLMILFSFIGSDIYGQYSADFRPENQLTYNYGYTEHFSSGISNAYPPHTRVTIQLRNCSMVDEYGNILPGTYFEFTGLSSYSFNIKFTKENTQATVTLNWVVDNTLHASNTWTINVRMIPRALSITGPDVMEKNEIQNFEANYSAHTSSTLYTWSSLNGNLTILSGQGTKNVTVKAISDGDDDLRVSAENLIYTGKIITITSNTTEITGQTITANKNYSNEYIQVANTTVTNNAVVNMTASNSVIINPNSYILSGTQVVIAATGNTLRYDAEDYEREEIQEDITSLDEIETMSGIKKLRIYSVTGTLIYESDTKFDLDLLNLSGIYIIVKEYNNGEIIREKILLENR